jgi:hypothetical protein
MLQTLLAGRENSKSPTHRPLLEGVALRLAIRPSSIMQLIRFLIAISVLVASCSSMDDQSLGGAEPRWSQRPEEAKRLPVGTVLSVARIDTNTGPSFTQPGAAGPFSQSGVRADNQAVAREASRKAVRLFRHSIRLLTGVVQDVDVEYAFSIGDCVALRTVRAASALHLIQLVEALPGECG